MYAPTAHVPSFRAGCPGIAAAGSASRTPLLPSGAATAAGCGVCNVVGVRSGDGGRGNMLAAAGNATAGVAAVIRALYHADGSGPGGALIRMKTGGLMPSRAAISLIAYIMVQPGAQCFRHGVCTRPDASMYGCGSLRTMSTVGRTKTVGGCWGNRSRTQISTGRLYRLPCGAQSAQNQCSVLLFSACVPAIRGC